MNAMLKQAQKMQEDMAALQEDLENREYTGTSGGGLITATVDGKHLIKARSSIMTIKFKDGTLVIADNALYGCGIKTLTFVDSIVSIGDYAFYGCERIKSVVLPSALQHIGSYAFANCQRLKTIKIPAGVITVGEKMLSGCTSLTKIYCGATAKPEGWDNNWNPTKVTPTWGSK